MGGAGSRAAIRAGKQKARAVEEWVEKEILPAAEAGLEEAAKRGAPDSWTICVVGDRSRTRGRVLYSRSPVRSAP